MINLPPNLLGFLKTLNFELSSSKNPEIKQKGVFKLKPWINSQLQLGRLELRRSSSSALSVQKANFKLAEPYTKKQKHGLYLKQAKYKDSDLFC